MEYILETERLRLRKLTLSDLDNLKETLQDPRAMYAYEGLSQIKRLFLGYRDSLRDTQSMASVYGESKKKPPVHSWDNAALLIRSGKMKWSLK